MSRMPSTDLSDEEAENLAEIMNRPHHPDNARKNAEKALEEAREHRRRSGYKPKREVDKFALTFLVLLVIVVIIACVVQLDIKL